MHQFSLESVQAITFDMYGTLLDLDASYSDSIGRFTESKGYAGDVAGVIAAWEAAYLHESMVDTLLDQGRTPFERVRRVCLGKVLSSLKVPYTPDDVENVLTTQSKVTLFSDVIEGLSALRDRFTLAVLSNGDLKPLERAVSGLNIPVPRVISAEQAGSYKPHPSVYRTAVEALGLPADQILHVASHPWDIRGAKTFGMLGAYINRLGVPYGESSPQADLEVPALIGLASKLS